jgi:hypothetical protein
VLLVCLVNLYFAVNKVVLVSLEFEYDLDKVTFGTLCISVIYRSMRWLKEHLHELKLLFALKVYFYSLTPLNIAVYS